jgi:hypothetical protein
MLLDASKKASSRPDEAFFLMHKAFSLFLIKKKIRPALLIGNKIPCTLEISYIF